MAAHEHTTGGFISGEVKLALTLRMLAGGSYLDLALLFEVGQSSAHAIFHLVVAEWINDERLVDINGIKYISDEGRMTQVALGFAQVTNGARCGCMGARDGWIVKIERPLGRNVTNAQTLRATIVARVQFATDIPNNVMVLALIPKNI